MKRDIETVREYYNSCPECRDFNGPEDTRLAGDRPVGADIIRPHDNMAGFDRTGGSYPPLQSAWTAAAQICLFEKKERNQ